MTAHKLGARMAALALVSTMAIRSEGKTEVEQANAEATELRSTRRADAQPAGARAAASRCGGGRNSALAVIRHFHTFRRR